MKDILLATITLLKANTAVAAIVGTRVYRNNLPVNYKISDGSAIVVVLVDKVQNEITSSAKYAAARVQCTSFAATGAAAEILSDLILAALEDQQNTLVSGVEIVDVDDVGSVPDYSDGLTCGMYRDNHDFKIIYRNH